eukprot:6210516-Pleurochrysis_carterae.AAC.1
MSSSRFAAPSRTAPSCLRLSSIVQTSCSDYILRSSFQVESSSDNSDLSTKPACSQFDLGTLRARLCESAPAPERARVESAPHHAHDPTATLRSSCVSLARASLLAPCLVTRNPMPFTARLHLLPVRRTPQLMPLAFSLHPPPLAFAPHPSPRSPPFICAPAHTIRAPCPSPRRPCSPPES